MFSYGRSPLGGAPIRFSFGEGEGPTTAAYGAMESEAQKRRMAEMMRLAGYRNMQYSMGAGGGMGILGGSPLLGNPTFSGGGMFGSSSPWMRSMPSLSFPSGGMM